MAVLGPVRLRSTRHMLESAASSSPNIKQLLKMTSLLLLKLLLPSDFVLAWLAVPQIVQLCPPHLAPAKDLYAL